MDLRQTKTWKLSPAPENEQRSRLDVLIITDEQGTKYYADRVYELYFKQTSGGEWFWTSREKLHDEEDGPTLATVLKLSDKMVEIPIERKPADLWCQCEHEKHFDGETGHPYGEHTDGSQIVGLITTFGKFNVCQSCRTDCHKTEA